MAETVMGFECPLTTWENHLRVLAEGGVRYETSFVQHWVHRVLFYEANERVFTVAYALFFLAVLLSLWLVRPRWPGRRT